jgi:membrane protein YqaA with SNARE-associated domain
MTAETAAPSPSSSGAINWRRTVVFAAQLCLVLTLLLVWLNSEAVRTSKNLWVLFLYCFPSEFLIAPVPHEPVIIYFGKYHAPLAVALISIAGTLLTEALNYSVFGYLVDTRPFRAVRYRGLVRRIVELFKKAPFAALCVAGFTPVPFYPLRFLVVLARYPLTRYLLALLLSRTPRFFILALVGRIVDIPDYLLVALFAVLVLVAAVYAGVARRALRRGQRSDVPPSEVAPPGAM